MALAIIIVLSMIDLLSIDSKYLNDTNYQEPNEYDQVFIPSPVNLAIAKDNSYYRVFDISNGVETAFNGNALTSVFHHSIGGYHAAKMSIYQDLIEKQLYKFPNCMPTINMLNTKYIIFKDPSSGQLTYQINPEAAGPCWLVDEVKTERNPSKIMSHLDSLPIKKTAIIEEDIKTKTSSQVGDSIWLISNQNDQVNYKSKTAGERFAVFSEVFYKHGWKAYVDGKEVPIYKTNYVLRGAYVPAGNHDIKFEFKPDAYYKGEWIGILANAAVWALLLLAGIMEYRKSRSL